MKTVVYRIKTFIYSHFIDFCIQILHQVKLVRTYDIELLIKQYVIFIQLIIALPLHFDKADNQWEIKYTSRETIPDCLLVNVCLKFYLIQFARISFPKFNSQPIDFFKVRSSDMNLGHLTMRTEGKPLSIDSILLVQDILLFVRNNFNCLLLL